LIHQLEPIEPFGIAQYVGGINELINRAQVDRQRPNLLTGDCLTDRVGKVVGVDDLKGAVIYLASRASDYMTGQVLVLDGGLTVW